MLKARSVALYAVAVITALGFCIGAEADGRIILQMMSAGTECNSVVLAH
jgi:uncharacterized metal-binding protein